MDVIQEIFSRGMTELSGRGSGPLHFRVVIMPIVVTCFGIWAGLRDAREARPAFLWALLTNPLERGRLLRSAAKDVGTVFIVATVLDTVYQLIVLRTFYLVQMLIMAVLCAIVPYALVRGPVARVARLFLKPRSVPVKNAKEKPRASLGAKASTRMSNRT